MLFAASAGICPKTEIYVLHVCRNVCLINCLEGCQGGSAVPRTVLAPLTGPQVNVLGIHFRRGICADAEERVYIPAGTQVRILGIHF